MGPINTRVVRRSHALQGFPYGSGFRYEEVMLTGPGLGGQLKAQAMAKGLGLLTQASPGSPLGWLMGQVLPKPGEGPSQQARENGFFKVYLFGQVDAQTQLTATVTGERDPGYGSTSRMLAEAALSLAQDELPDLGGVLTPSVAMGDALLRRLPARAGVHFDLRSTA